MDYFDPPPPYSPPSLLQAAPSSTSPPSISQSSQPRSQPQIQPPSYRPSLSHPSPILTIPVPKTTTPPTTTKILPPQSESLLLKTILTTHKWPSFYGPRPSSLTTALSKAALWGNTPLVNSILATHDAKVRDARNGVPGYVIEGLVGMVGIEKGRGLIEERDGKGRTALHLAARFTHRDSVGGLLGLGADPGRVLDRQLWEGVEEHKRMEVMGCWGLIVGVLREEVGKRGGILVVDGDFKGGKVRYDERDDVVLVRHGSSMSRTAMPSILFSEEYLAWKRGCDKLLEESRAQKARDRRNEMWMLDVMGTRQSSVGKH
ncbi:hypothetical protein B0T21DRAFT_450870 [Apiosordaria backusii]|uniref:Ankyrin n=1 Tax=Apiosordaria backusii TaxID=314023 RepID=A0AA40BKQ0_9PEZI|nr:hypothetical protein B0T21DRAFT_450870 [Apiosordaria backusii]